MRHALAAFAIASGGLVTAVPAVALTVNLSDAVLAGGVSLIGGGSKIQFDSQASGQSATFTLPSIPGREYSIEVTGHNNASTSFFQFLIDTDGAGPGGFVQLGGNLIFGSSPILAPRTSSRLSTMVLVTRQDRSPEFHSLPYLVRL
jgi:hypothetical protein